MSTQFAVIESVRVDAEHTTLEVWTTKNGTRWPGIIHLPYPTQEYQVGQTIELTVAPVTN